MRQLPSSVCSSGVLQMSTCFCKLATEKEREGGGMEGGGMERGRDGGKRGSISRRKRERA